MSSREEWRPVRGWPYEVSSEGRVRRATAAAGTSAGRVLRPHAQANGYLSLSLSSQNRQKQVLVHELACEAFHGPRPPGHQVRHLDGSRQNNRSTNLRWGTAAENAADKRAHGTMPLGDRHARTKVREEAYAAILAAWDRHPRGYGRTGAFIAQVMAEHGVSKGFVEDAIYGRVRATRVRDQGLVL